MADNAARIAACVDIPVIADADTGYGNPLNVIRTVGAYEAAGVAGIHIEDQVAPKKCGHLEGKLVIPAKEMAEKIRAAVEARTQPEFVIIARTDARAVEGLERSLQRGDARIADVRRVRGFHRSAPGARGRTAVRGPSADAGAGERRYGWQRHLSGPA
jgi:2,3-dimethylmalate lyase